MPSHNPSVICLSVVSLLTLLLRPTQAQDAPEPPRPPAFSTLFKNPTGTNAYEDWVYAADLIQNNKLADAAQEEGASLTLKRRLCNDPTVQQALFLLHKSLDKPVQPPGVTIDEHTQFLEFSALRKLARLLNVQIYIDCADGRMDAAMEVLNDALRFGYRMQTDSLVSGLVGTVVESTALKSFARHLDQLSEYQCSHLQRLVEEWLESPSPAVAILANDKRVCLQSLEAQRNDLQSVEQMIARTYPDATPPPPNAQALLNSLQTRPSEFGPAMDRVKTLVAARFDNTLANLKLPVKERKALPEIKADTLDGLLFHQLAPSLTHITDQYDRTQSLIRLLGIHAAIRRYRWEHNFLPNSLADLHLGVLNTDPFTGNSFLYQRAGAGYDLSGLGPVEQSQQGQTAAAPTQPVRL